MGAIAIRALLFGVRAPGCWTRPFPSGLKGSCMSPPFWVRLNILGQLSRQRSLVHTYLASHLQGGRTFPVFGQAMTAIWSHTYMYIYILYIYICIYIYTYTYTYMCICVCVLVHAQASLCVVLPFLNLLKLQLRCLAGSCAKY